MRDQKHLPEVGTKLRTHHFLGDTRGWSIKERNLITRQADVDCTYQGWVPGHGGDVWWCINADGTVAAYSYTELEFDLDALRAKCQELEQAVENAHTAKMLYFRRMEGALKNVDEQATYITKLEAGYISAYSMYAYYRDGKSSMKKDTDEEAREALAKLKEVP